MTRRIPQSVRALLVACALLGGAAAAAATAPAPATAAASATAHARGLATQERILAFEQAGRARPKEVAGQLRQLLATMLADDPRRSEALQVLGLMFALGGDATAARGVADELARLGSDDPTGLALPAADLVRGGATAAAGEPLRQADRLIASALDRLPADVPGRVRLRFLAKHADIKGDMGEFDAALQLHQEALRLADAEGADWQRVDQRAALAYLCFRIGQRDRGRQLIDEARAMGELIGDHLSLSTVHNIDGMLLQGVGDPVLELRAMERALEQARLAQAPRAELVMLGNMADYHLQRGHYELALRTARSVLPMARAARSTDAEVAALANMGLALISLHRKGEGMRYVRESLAIDERRGAVSSMKDMHGELGRYLEQAGELRDAYAAYQRYRALADEVLRRDQQQVVLELQERFDDENRTRALALLRSDNALNAEQLRTRQLQQRLWAAAALAAAASMLLALWAVRRLRRANQKLEQGNRLLQQQSERDALTGLANRHQVRQRLESESDAQGLQASLFMIDLDHFKVVNDRLGHASGDKVLEAIARRLEPVVRERDLVARWGGEEFVVIAWGLPAEAGRALARRLLAAICAEDIVVDGRALRVTASIGHASFPLAPAAEPTPWPVAIELVDAALYLAKARGRNVAVGIEALADPARDAGPQALLALAQELEAAWREARISLAFDAGPEAGRDAAPAPSAIESRLSALESRE
ncbi:GGDEF domain-containing protein [Rivibacter subsaxonicus]|uniref:diguanylate cyclase n=1 Tax=Rivibacter subsaxonicus TaxID=457575 RepID=A0A4Q7VWK3_9BURK|nr:GGDEF domain-containing protein [Rivibacter subsaxonicus]RZU01050.1 diguanylate cyclase (GGDEF)-like protein [Rivibacter subsaxonicus]